VDVGLASAFVALASETGVAVSGALETGDSSLVVFIFSDIKFDSDV
jgi:hypothetical protein